MITTRALVQTYTMAIISTAHIREKTDRALRDECIDLVCYDPVDCGYLFFVGDQWKTPPAECDLHHVVQASRYPELFSLLHWAALQGYDYLRLDADAPAVDSLPTFDW